MQRLLGKCLGSIFHIQSIYGLKSNFHLQMDVYQKFEHLCQIITLLAKILGRLNDWIRRVVAGKYVEGDATLNSQMMTVYYEIYKKTTMPDSHMQCRCNKRFRRIISISNAPVISYAQP